MEKEPLARSVARLEKLTSKLRTGTGPNYPALAQIQAEINALAADPPEPVPPLAMAVIGSLARVTNRLMHDHPKFTDLIESHVAALHLASSRGTALGKAEADRLIADLEAATAKVLTRRAPR